MLRIKLFFATFLGLVLLMPGVAVAQTSITNNSGTSGLYNANNSSYYQSASGGNQQSTGAGLDQKSISASELLQNTSPVILIDPSSAPAFSTTESGKNNSIRLAALAIAFVIIGAGILVVGAYQQSKAKPDKPVEAKKVATPEEPEVISEEPAKEEKPKAEPEKEVKKESKSKKKKHKKKKHHR